VLALKPRAAPRSGCSRSLANLRDVIHGSKRHPGQPPSCSPRSIGSSEFLNPIAHEVVLSTNSRCELKITGFGGCGGLGAVGTAAHDADGGAADGAVVSSFVGTLRPGTPGPAWAGHGLPYSGNGRRTEEERRKDSCVAYKWAPRVRRPRQRPAWRNRLAKPPEGVKCTVFDSLGC